MTQAMERLDVPVITYHALERIAQFQGKTPAGVVETFVQQFDQTVHLVALRQEYQQLADKELARTITEDEAERIEAVAEQISDIEMHSETNRIWEEQAEKMNALLHDLKCTLEAFPGKNEVAV